MHPDEQFSARDEAEPEAPRRPTDRPTIPVPGVSLEPGPELRLAAYLQRLAGDLRHGRITAVSAAIRLRAVLEVVDK